MTAIRENAVADRAAGEDGPVETVLNDLVGYNLKRAYMIIQADFRETLGEDGLTAREFSALSMVVERPNITQSELARIFRIERSGLVAIIDLLEQRGYLTRVSVPGDRRVQALSPTAEGIRAFGDILHAVRQHEERLLSPLSRAEQVQLLGLLRKFRRAAEKDV